MSNADKQVIGILGGMGPDATAFFFRKILALTDAKKDQDHPQVLINSDSTIPDRTQAILSKDTQPVAVALQSAASVLERAGATFIAIPCNTAHFWIDEIRDAVDIPVLDMIALTIRYIRDDLKVSQIGLLATIGSMKTALYQRQSEQLGIAVVLPNDDDATRIMQIIGAIKHGETSPGMRVQVDEIGARLGAAGAEKVVLGCTELPLLYPEKPGWLIDPMDVLARAALKSAGLPKKI